MRAIVVKVVILVLLGCSDTHQGVGPSLAPEAGSSGRASDGTAGKAGSGPSTGTAGKSSSTAGAQAQPAPKEHRAVAETCDRMRPPGDEPGGLTPPPGGDPGCGVDAECVEGSNGRCEEFRGLRMCTYDECFTDADCGGRGPCGCERAFWSDANACLEGNCRTDRDCGPNGYCSPTFGSCGNYSGVVGYYCHTRADECLDDADCIDPQQGAGYCMYSPEVSHWVCAYSSCVG